MTALNDKFILNNKLVSYLKEFKDIYDIDYRVSFMTYLFLFLHNLNLKVKIKVPFRVKTIFNQ